MRSYRPELRKAIPKDFLKRDEIRYREACVYISKFSITNIKCFENASFTFPGKPGDHAGWHVLLGINGTGKSTLLQAMALSMLGPVSGARLLQQPGSWVRVGTQYGEVQAGLTTGQFDTTNAGAPRKQPYDAHLLITGAEPVSIEGTDYSLPQVTLFKNALGKSLNSGPHSNRHGWFSAGYGPFRRLTGSGGEDDVGIQYGQGREARHLTLFRESAALTRCEKWLASLHSQSIDPALTDRALSSARLAEARRIIDGLLPNGVRIDSVTALGVTFATRSGVKINLSQLSDGYRSFLALTMDLLRHILDSDERGTVADTASGRASIDTEGVVLIDEADAHLHPTWQRDIGFLMVEVFPKIQFVVSTHSPFVAQAAKDGGLFMVNAGANQCVTVEPAEQSVRGWRADQILLSPLFGLGSTRDPETESLFRRQAELQAKGVPLTKPEGDELGAIQVSLRQRLTAPGDTLEERERDREMRSFIDQKLEQHRGGGAK